MLRACFALMLGVAISAALGHDAAAQMGASTRGMPNANYCTAGSCAPTGGRWAADVSTCSPKHCKRAQPRAKAKR